MELSELKISIDQVRELSKIFQAHAIEPEHPYKVGENYFIRTVTHHLTGKLVQVTRQELVLERAAWIADDGKFSEALKKEVFNEVEMFPDDRQVIIGRGSLIDAVIITNIPTSSK